MTEPKKIPLRELIYNYSQLNIESLKLEIRRSKISEQELRKLLHEQIDVKKQEVEKLKERQVKNKKNNNKKVSVAFTVLVVESTSFFVIAGCFFLPNKKYPRHILPFYTATLTGVFPGGGTRFMS